MYCFSKRFSNTVIFHLPQVPIQVATEKSFWCGAPNKIELAVVKLLKLQAPRNTPYLVQRVLFSCESSQGVKRTGRRPLGKSICKVLGDFHILKLY